MTRDRGTIPRLGHRAFLDKLDRMERVTTLSVAGFRCWVFAGFSGLVGVVRLQARLRGTLMDGGALLCEGG